MKRHFFTIFFLGFSSGLPLALTSSALQAWYTQDGISIISIGLLGLLQQPYTYKFFWSPLLDRFALPFFSRRRGWMLITQLLLVISIFAMSFFAPAQYPWLLAGLGFSVALFSATQDVVLDAYRTDILPPEEWGLGASNWVGGYRIAMLISGGLGFVIADQIGWANTYRVMAGLMLIGVLTTCLSPSEPNGKLIPTSLREAIVEPFKDLWQRLPLFWIAGFIILYKLGDAFALTLTTPFLLRGLHFSLTEVGLVVKSVGLAATLIGVFLGGSLLNRLGMYRSLLYFGILQALSNLCFMFLAIAGHNFTIMTLSIFIENLCAGMGTAAFLAFLMALCNHHYTATQFALLSALSAVGRVYVGSLAGILVLKLGWVMFYFSTFFFALPGLLILLLMGAKYHFSEQGLRLYEA